MSAMHAGVKPSVEYADPDKLAREIDSLVTACTTATSARDVMMNFIVLRYEA